MVEEARRELQRRGGMDRFSVAGAMQRGVTLPFASTTMVEERR